MTEQVENKEVKTEAVTTATPADKKSNTNNRDNRNKGSKGPRKFNKKDDDIEERVVAINRVVKTTKGGRAFRFAALVVVGDKKGRVGFGTGKAKEVPDAIKKAIKDARAKMLKVKMVKDGTIPHEQLGKYGSGKVLLKPAKSGVGIIAGGPVRAVMELAGIKNIYSKSLGSNTPVNVIRATIEGLKVQRTYSDVMRARGLDNGGAK